MFNSSIEKEQEERNGPNKELYDKRDEITSELDTLAREKISLLDTLAMRRCNRLLEAIEINPDGLKDQSEEEKQVIAKLIGQKIADAEDRLLIYVTILNPGLKIWSTKKGAKGEDPESQKMNREITDSDIKQFVQNVTEDGIIKKLPTPTGHIYYTKDPNNPGQKQLGKMGDRLIDEEATEEEKIQMISLNMQSSEWNKQLTQVNNLIENPTASYEV